MKAYRIAVLGGIAAAIIFECTACTTQGTVQSPAEKPAVAEEVWEAEGSNAEELSFLSGMWVTGSMGYEYYGKAQAEYYVQFTDSEIIYGHMRDEEFVPDHSDKIDHIDCTEAGEYLIKAETSSGIQYSYSTNESYDDVLEYHSTWNEDEFPKTYSGGASLTRID